MLNGLNALFLVEVNGRNSVGVRFIYYWIQWFPRCVEEFAPCLMLTVPAQSTHKIVKCYVEGMVDSVPWGKGDFERLVIIVLCISNMFGCRADRENEGSLADCMITQFWRFTRREEWRITHWLHDNPTKHSFL